MTESKIESTVCKHAHKMGVLVYKFTSPGRAGVPDRMFIARDGRVLFIEFKTPTGKLSPLQVNEHRRLRDYQQQVWVVDNVAEGKRIVDSYAI